MENVAVLTLTTRGQTGFKSCTAIPWGISVDLCALCRNIVFIRSVLARWCVRELWDLNHLPSHVGWRVEEEARVMQEDEEEARCS